MSYLTKLLDSTRARVAEAKERVTADALEQRFDARAFGRVRIDREAAARFVAGRAMLPLVLLPILGDQYGAVLERQDRRVSGGTLGPRGAVPLFEQRYNATSRGVS